jgi:hypothetical protein
MPAKDGRVMTVSPKFADMMKRGYVNTNGIVKTKFGKDMTFIDFTDFIAELMSDDFDVVLTRGMLVPKKRGRKSNKVRFDMIPI